MSNLILSPVWKMKLKASAKFVAVSLADQANDDGFCWPGIKSISKRTCISERTVQESIRYLESIRLITIVDRPGKSNGYQFNMQMIRQSELFGGADDDDESPKGVRNSQGCEIRRGANAAPRGAKSAGEGCEIRTQTINNHQEPSGGEGARPRDRVRISEDWQPDAATIERCRKANFPPVTPGEITAFVAHHRAIGNTFEPSAIDDAFVGWMHKAIRFGGKTKTSNAPSPLPTLPDGTPDFMRLSETQLTSVRDEHRLMVRDSGVKDLNDLRQRFADAWNAQQNRSTVDSGGGA